MNISLVQTLMRDENELGCNIARIKKDDSVILIVNKENDTAVYDYLSLINHLEPEKYLLFKHYDNTDYAYHDFLKIIGKMCKKEKSSKYFLNHVDEDNRIIYEDYTKEHMITRPEKEIYDDRLKKFADFMKNNARLIDILLESE